MKKRNAFAVILATAVGVGSLAYLFLWGTLFPYSPVVLGFARHELSYVVIYVQDGAGYSDFTRIDTLVPVVEEFHDLRFLKKPDLFIFRDSSNYLQRSPSNARICAFYNGAIVISPWLVQEDRDGVLSLSVYVQHELSHSLLFQHMGFYRAYRSPQWLIEGIAVFSTNQMGTSFYPGREETYALLRQGNYMPPQYFKTSKEDDVTLNVRYRLAFMYSEFACIVDYLVAVGGRNKFLAYMKSLLHNSNHDAVFKDVYGIDFDQSLSNFREHVKIQDTTQVVRPPASER
ncbi:MAG: hypothetical protein NTV54_10605 [Ignavibacteriales bacterium]|nr:hypothetical protein [Ignavibacteriales bacterium]